MDELVDNNIATATCIDAILTDSGMVAPVEIFPGEEAIVEDNELVLPDRSSIFKMYFWLPREIRPVNLHRVAELTYSSRAYLIQDGAALEIGNICTLHVCRDVKRAIESGTEFQSNEQVPQAFILLHANFTTYGHFLLEMAPKLLAYNTIVQAVPGLPIILPTQTPNFIRKWISFLSPDANVLALKSPDPVSIKSAFLSDMLVTHYMCGNAMKAFISECVTRAAAATANIDGIGRRIYVSRRARREAQTDFRELQNSAQVEMRMSELGFAIVFPELMDVAQQIRTFADADIIVGETSSALHNAIFSAPGTLIVQLNPFTGVQRQLALSLGHTLVSVIPDDGVLRGWPAAPNIDLAFTVDPASIENAIEQGLRNLSRSL